MRCLSDCVIEQRPSCFSLLLLVKENPNIVHKNCTRHETKQVSQNRRDRRGRISDHARRVRFKRLAAVDRSDDGPEDRLVREALAKERYFGMESLSASIANSAAFQRDDLRRESSICG